MSGSTSLGDRMKTYEAAHRTVLPRRTYTLLRLDIRAAHTYLRGAQQPFDEEFMADMDAVAEALCAEITGSAFAYTQSDEISILVTDFATVQTQPWFGGVVAKQLSISAALATAVLNERRPGRRALFDSRVFTLADPVEVANYFIWRQRDAVRNSVSMAAQAHFSHNRLQGVSSSGMQELLWSELGVNWNDYPPGCKRGRVTVRRTGERPGEYVDKRTRETVHTLAVRSWWETFAPQKTFTTEPGGWLAEAIPAMSSLRESPPAACMNPGE
jgi:tRNA(His) guanylyltransferase